MFSGFWFWENVALLTSAVTLHEQALSREGFREGMLKFRVCVYIYIILYYIIYVNLYM